MLKWYQEPLVHFLVLGTLLFFLSQSDTFSSINKNTNTLIVKEEEIKKRITFWKKRYHTVPTQDEVDTLLKVYIENEILYAKALDMKLDRNDDAMKQLMVNKLKYIVSEPVNIDNISDKELKTFFHDNKNLFKSNIYTTITFGHIYFNPKDNNSMTEKANDVYMKIKNKAFQKRDANYGNHFYKGSYFSKMSTKELSKIFTHSFVQILQKLPQRQWSKPINSGYGTHLIYIEQIDKTKLSFNKMKDKIKNKYIIHKSHENYAKFYENIKKEYQVIIEPYTLQDKE